MINLQYDQEVEYQAIREEERAEGVALGMERGVEQGKIETAKNLLQTTLTLEEIAEATGLTISKIESLKEPR